MHWVIAPVPNIQLFVLEDPIQKIPLLRDFHGIRATPI
jgi:hypothetical protein